VSNPFTGTVQPAEPPEDDFPARSLWLSGNLSHSLPYHSPSPPPSPSLTFLPSPPPHPQPSVTVLQEVRSLTKCQLYRVSLTGNLIETFRRIEFFREFKILAGSHVLRDSPTLLEVLSNLQEQQMPTERGNAVLSLQYTVCGQHVVVMFLLSRHTHTHTHTSCCDSLRCDGL